jgi:hypothetical protein
MLLSLLAEVLARKPRKGRANPNATVMHLGASSSQPYAGSDHPESIGMSRSKVFHD